jgi:hypothetical protein
VSWTVGIGIVCRGGEERERERERDYDESGECVKESQQGRERQRERVSH